MNLEEIRRLCDEATSGPWQADGDGGSSWDSERGYARSCVDTPLGSWWSGSPISGSDMSQLAADARFIAAARTVLPELLERMRKLEGECDHLMGLVEEKDARIAKLEAVASAAEARCAACLPDTREFEDERLRKALAALDADAKEKP